MVRQLGERLKQLRRAKGYTNYEQFAFDHNLGRAQVWRYESGTEDIRFTSLTRVCEALGVTLAEFFAEGFD